ncbi:metal-sulfur cluster assembly factor [Pseudoscardovia suis]|uniref:FeS assembly SUF system domain n=1 Tax=Pseudoscardovia suis TaxID=987063 RepID=A0A261ERK3_9BIFI|nr:metal-sulfur cluster assembly factor [Pseudoscardovia suis]OZG49471.1 FeS assembly SUF system domain [Pseudoscardovia suis]PJJ69591.1 metal-sulfur cluster biosynthetic enzyme [Pseudoscardovia suis]
MANDNLVPPLGNPIFDAVNSAIDDPATAQSLVSNPAATKQLLDAAEQKKAQAGAQDVQEETAAADAGDAAKPTTAADAAEDMRAQARRIAKDHQEGKVDLKAVDSIGRATAADVQEALHQVIDPELGVDVMDLGLVYGIEIDELGRAIITMTLTTPACPLTSLIEDECATVLAGLVEEFRIDWTWTPPWNVDMMTPEGAEQMAALGFNAGNLPQYGQ